MNIQVTEVDNIQKVLATFQGKVSITQIISDFRNLAKEQAKSSKKVDIIWDFSDAEAADLSFELIDQIAEIILTDKNAQQNIGESAYVIDQRAEKHLLNYLVDTLKSAGYNRKVNLFHHVEQAKKHLNFPEN